MDIRLTAVDVRLGAVNLSVPDGSDDAIDHLIARAVALLVLQVPTVPARVDAGTLDQAVVEGVVEDMVLRVLRNPQALRQISIDDFSATVDAAVSAGSLYVSSNELALLSPSTRGGHRAFGSVRVGVPEWRLPRV